MMRKILLLGLLLATKPTRDAFAQNQEGPISPPASTDSAPPATDAGHPPRIRVGGTVQAAKLIYQVQPVCPKEAKEKQVSGTVVLRAVISQDGSLKDLEFVSGPELLKQAAMDAVRQWRYAPTLLEGRPIEVNTTIQVVFTLGESRQTTSDESATQDQRSPISRPDAAPPTLPSVPDAGVAPRPPLPHPTRIRIGGNVQAAKLVHKVSPIYPEEAKEQHVAGTVLLHVIVARDGSIQTVEYVSGPDLLKQAAIDAVQKWRYAPTLLNGEPVEVDTAIQVVFTLS